MRILLTSGGGSQGSEETVVEKCTANNHGGTHHMIYIPFEYPTNELESPITGTAYGNVGSCRGRGFPVTVALCPGGFCVYKPLKHPYSAMGYLTCKLQLDYVISNIKITV